MQPLATSSNEIDALLDWLRTELAHTDFGEVGLKFKIHQGAVVGIERTTSVKGKFTLQLLSEDGGE